MAAQCERGVVGSGRRGRGRGRGCGAGCGRGRGRGRRGAVRAVRAPVQQRVEPAPARAADP